MKWHLVAFKWLQLNATRVMAVAFSGAHIYMRHSSHQPQGGQS